MELSGLNNLSTEKLTDSESNQKDATPVTCDEPECLKADEIFVGPKLEEEKNLEKDQDVETNHGIKFEDCFYGYSIESPYHTNYDFYGPIELQILKADAAISRREFRRDKSTQTSNYQQMKDKINSYIFQLAGFRCEPKLSEIEKTDKNIEDHNNESRESTNQLSHSTFMDDDQVEDERPISSAGTCSLTGSKVRTSSESSDESSRSIPCNSDSDDSSTEERIKNSPMGRLLTLIEERSKISEDNKERRFRELMAFKAQKAEEDCQFKERALDLLEKFIQTHTMSKTDDVF
ncbi:GSCOCG00009045001-RA-CDS [Cotesia congregata]|uniref:Uncharacterized protein n=1 Tax=Cotesia congregata TaxID=51543 RepID=A0A8J2H949_COTCN|nr:GSCOCG00009045001-RA-CDS [Cotesia congregata]CAG5083253.1 Protein of unknown function [Cotesia congregata]